MFTPICTYIYIYTHVYIYIYIYIYMYMIMVNLALQESCAVSMASGSQLFGKDVQYLFSAEIWRRRTYSQLARWMKGQCSRSPRLGRPKLQSYTDV